MTRRRWRPIGPYAKDFGRWLGWNMGWFMLFFFILPMAQPQKAGSWLRPVHVILDNIGLTWYEGFGFLWLVLFMAGFVVFMKPTKSRY